MENKKAVFDYEALKKKTLEQFRSGKSLYGKGGAFAPLLKDFLEAALQAELDDHLNGKEPEENNRKNGYTTKQLKTVRTRTTIDNNKDKYGQDFQ